MAAGEGPGAERSWQPDFPIDLGAVLGPLSRGAGYRTFQFAGPLAGHRRSAWWATSTPNGPGTLHLVTRPGDGEVLASAWGPGAQWLCDRVPTLLGADDDLQAFEPVHPQVLEAWRRAPGWRLMCTGRPLDACLNAVIEQKVTGAEARRAWQALVGRFGEPAHGPAPRGMATPPTPTAWRDVSDADFRRAGVTPHRVRTLRTVASAARAIERTSDGTSSEADRVLRALPGIGAWTSAEVRQRSHGDPDALSVGDFHVAKDLCYWLTGERGDDARMEELLEPYVGHRYRVQRLMEMSGVGAPRRGPRMAVPRHRSG
ncbi:MAG TPA: DNA-3-methyladenine glycosylase 2 family protein [Actinomycetes bacterium]|nr:DNA-3-methyladenine glycosylase 2 family protein [Actinomycetes bacterium]